MSPNDPQGDQSGSGTTSAGELACAGATGLALKCSRAITGSVRVGFLAGDVNQNRVVTLSTPSCFALSARRVRGGRASVEGFIMTPGRMVFGYLLALFCLWPSGAMAQVITEFSAGITAAAFPYDITAGPDGNLWFTEYNGTRIGRITPLGV